MRCISAFALAILISGCGSAPSGRTQKFYSAGERATVGPLTYNVIDTQILPRLGDDPANPRVPQNRFFLVQVSVSNGGNSEAPVPAMTLIDESGKAYTELADGTGVPHWLGVVRHVGPGQTEQGNVVFDAPATHMKLKLTEDTDDTDVSVDIPLSFAHEQLNDSVAPTTPPAAPRKK